MAETLVENQICKSCGADVREDALFCYNCGKSVAPEIVAEENHKKDEVSNTLRREKITENGNREKTKDGELKEYLPVETVADKPIPKPDMPAEAKLKTTAATRRKSATYQNKTVEVVWEEYENAPNGWFIVAALILTLFAVGIFFLAMYLK